MPTKLKDDAGITRLAARIRFRDETNTLRTLQRIRMRDETNTLRTVFLYLTAALNINNTIGVDSGASISGSVTTSDTITCTPTGGTGPYTYAWSRVTGSSAIAIDSPTAAITSFTVTTAFDGIGYIATFICTVTDANGAVAESGSIVVEIYWFKTA